MEKTSEILKGLFDIVIWGAVPLILLVILYLTRAIMSKADDKRQKSAMRSGFWAGLLLFLMVLIYQVAIFLRDGFPEKGIFQGFNLWLAIGVGILTFFAFLGGKKIVAPGLAGFTTLLIVFITSYALLHYLFIRTWNELVLSLTMGIAFGILSHFSNPSSFIRKTLKGTFESGGGGGHH